MVLLNGHSYSATHSIADEDSFTASCWVNLRSTGFFGAVWDLDGLDGLSYLALGLDDDNSHWTWFAFDGTSFDQHPITAASTDEWIFFGVVRESGGTTLIYYRTVSQPTLTSTTSGTPVSPSAPTLLVGTNVFADSINADVIGLRFWDAELTQNELLNESYQLAPERFEDSVHWYPLHTISDTEDEVDFNNDTNLSRVSGAPGEGAKPPVAWCRRGAYYTRLRHRVFPIGDVAFDAVASAPVSLAQPVFLTPAGADLEAAEVKLLQHLQIGPSPAAEFAVPAVTLVQPIALTHATTAAAAIAPELREPVKIEPCAFDLQASAISLTQAVRLPPVEFDAVAPAPAIVDRVTLAPAPINAQADDLALVQPVAVPAIEFDALAIAPAIVDRVTLAHAEFSLDAVSPLVVQLVRLPPIEFDVVSPAVGLRDIVNLLPAVGSLAVPAPSLAEKMLLLTAAQATWSVPAISLADGPAQVTLTPAVATFFVPRPQMSLTAFLLQQKRIHNALIDSAKAGSFPKLTFDPSTGHVDAPVIGPFEAPAVVLAGIETASFAVPQLNRREGTLYERERWLWQVILAFHVPVSVELWEKELERCPIVLPHDPANDLKQVTIKPVGTTITNPPRQQPSSGTEAIVRVEAVVSPL